MVAIGEQPGGTVAGFSAERVDHLLGAEPRWNLSRRTMLSTILTVAALVAGGLALMASTRAAEVNAALSLLRSCFLILVAGSALVLAAFLRTLRVRPRGRRPPRAGLAGSVARRRPTKRMPREHRAAPPAAAFVLTRPDPARGARARAALLAAICASAVAPAAAAAHAAFQDSSPEAGSRLAAAPAQIALAFSEPLNRRLTTARLVDARTRRPIAATVSVERGDRLSLRPQRRLPTGAFLVEWHTVSILDGHALEGSFGFGVRASAIGGHQRLEQSPLARDGWLRVALRSLWYTALFFFGGGLLCAVALRSPRGPGGWLLVDLAGDQAGGGSTDMALRRIWHRTLAAGWLAALAGIGVALVETRDAAGSLSWSSIDAFLLATVSGGARALAVAAVALAALLARRWPRLATLALLGALAAVALGGHANSASPRALALLSDWVHLVAGTAWVGGIAQIVATWIPQIGRLSFDDRRRVIGEVLDRFGTLALPAAATTVLAGAVNALIELGRVSELWSSAYGRVLIVKIGLAVTLLSVSYLHAFRLRPRIVAADAGASAAERRHWRLLRSQPAFAVGVLAAGALLAVFPLPPRQLLERADAGPAAQGGVRAAAVLRPPRAGELAVAEQAGPWIAAVWVGPSTTPKTGTLRLLDLDVRPVAASIAIAGAAVARCGTGCVTFRKPGPAATLSVSATLGRRTHRTVIPIGWDPGRTPAAERVLARAVAAVDRLRSQRIAERLTSGLGGGEAVSRYRISGRHRYSIVSRNAGASETIVIGRRYWVRQPDGSWQRQVGSSVDARELMPWWAHRTGVRLLGVRSEGGRRVDELALADIPRPGRRSAPFWFRLRVDLASMRVVAMRMIAPGHFMDQRYFGFDEPVQIRPPTLRGRR